MVRRVKPGELCGTIAGLPRHQETRIEEKRRGGSRDWGVGWVLLGKVSGVEFLQKRR